MCLETFQGLRAVQGNAKGVNLGKVGEQFMKRIGTVLFVLLMGTVPAWAALGDDVSSVDSDVQVMRGQRHMIAKVGYNLHQITTPDGSVVNEFVSPAGVVFGVSWQGTSLPNLPQLLGTYLTNLQQGQRTKVVPRRAVTIEDNNFVFTSIGRLRSFRGRAYVPGLVPANLTPEVVQ